MDHFEKQLEDYALVNKIRSKGSLSVVLVVTRMAKKMDFPVNPEDMLTTSGGQVQGLGRAAVQAILKDHGIDRVLSEEGGRTSRGSVDNMRKYAQFLNNLHKDNLLNLDQIEIWWVKRISEYFANKPFKFKIDASKSLRSAVKDLIDQSFKRQQDMPGTRFAGTVFQHLVGAKLELILPQGTVKHYGSSVADASSNRLGDFELDDVRIHVTTAPTEALVRKCQNNLDNGLRPLVITTAKGAAGIDLLAVNAGVEGRIDVFEIEQFIASNIYEISKFSQEKRYFTVEQIISKYNAIIEECETDPSLKIDIDKNG